MKKSVTTRELVNLYPPTSRIRITDQAVGYQFLNTIGVPMERMDQELEKMQKNQYLTTANLDEIDIVYKTTMPTTFEFEQNLSDPTNPCPIAPTVSGLVVNDTFSGYLTVALADENDVKTFWYTSIPNRVSLETTDSGNFSLLTKNANEFPNSGLLTHHLNKGGTIWVEAIGGVEYISINDRGEVDRGEVIIEGVTRKGTSEKENLIFAWDQKQRTFKDWKKINRIEVYNVESGVQLDFRSADFNQGPYLSFWNLRFSDIRTKIDEFWDIGTNEQDKVTLDRIAYVGDEWQQLMLGFSETEVREQWELIDVGLNPIDPVDMAIQPFTNRAWMVTSDGRLFAYSLEEEMVSGLDFLKERTNGPYVQLEIENERVTLEEDMSITPWHARPLQDIDRFRVSLQDPSGTQSGILDGELVDFTSNFFVFSPDRLKRLLDEEIILSASQRGEYKFTIEAFFEDGTKHVDRRIISVQWKIPIVELDLTDIISETIEGIDFDSDQKMWIKTATTFYQVNLHADLMIIDYANKVFYFKETYQDVGVKT